MKFLNIIYHKYLKRTKSTTASLVLPGFDNRYRMLMLITCLPEAGRGIVRFIPNTGINNMRQ